MKPGTYRCGDCGQIHQGKPDPQWNCCPTCLVAFQRKYAEIVASAKPKKTKVKQLELF